MWFTICNNCIKRYCGNAKNEKRFCSLLCDSPYLGVQILMKSLSFFRQCFLQARLSLSRFSLRIDVFCSHCSDREMTNDCFSCIAALCDNARRLFCDSSSTPVSTVRDSGTVVQLLSPEGVVVGTGAIESGFKTGTVLVERKLFPFEAAVRVISVVDGTFWTGETYNEHLGSCMGLVIRWKKSLLRTVESGSAFGKNRRLIQS